MAGSSGTISRVMGGETTSLSEANRQQAAINTSAPSILNNPGSIYGIIFEVDKTNMFVKAYNKQDSSSINNGNWIPIIEKQKPGYIVERFGTVQVGMIAKITYTGLNSLNPEAEIIGENDETLNKREWELNDKALGIWEIFR